MSTIFGTVTKEGNYFSSHLVMCEYCGILLSTILPNLISICNDKCRVKLERETGIKRHQHAYTYPPSLLHLNKEMRL